MIAPGAPGQKAYFVHPQAICETTAVGARTRIWAFAHVLPGAVIGEDCNLCDGVFVENDVVVGDRVTVKSGVQLWDGVVLEDDVFVGPNATFTNDAFPRSRTPPPEFARTRIRRHASIGANATILPGITIEPHAMVGAGAVVTKSVPAHAIVVGNPARIVGYVDADLTKSAGEGPGPRGATGSYETGVHGVVLRDLPRVEDIRGNLSVGQFGQEVPFSPRRYFVVFDVPDERTRGQHAHRVCQQFLICVRGTCSVVVDDGLARREVKLDRPSLGLYVPPMTWTVQYKYSPDAVLLVFASHAYDPADYLRDYEEFLAEAQKEKPDRARS